MRKQRVISVVLLLFLSLGIGCATTEKQQLSMEMYNKYKQIAILEENIIAAESNEVNTFAPKGFNSAKKLLNQSTDMARQGKGDQATLIAEKGLDRLNRADNDAQKSRNLLWEVVKNREQARKANAPNLFPDEYTRTEKTLLQATGLIETGNTEKAKELDTSLIKSYSELEIKSLKKTGVLAVAEATFAQLEINNAEDIAPRTFQQAKKELDFAMSILKADRTQTKKANAHADLASKLAGKANQITDLVKMFKRRDYSYEDIVLWYHEQLNHINEPLQGEVDFTQPNRIIVRSLTEKVGACVKNLEDSQKAVAYQHETQKKLQQEYELQLSAQTNQQKLEEQRRIEINEKYTYVDSLFSHEDAQVFRKGNNVMIAAHGFFFPVGEAEIRTVNFALLDKIIKAIKQFPNAEIEISGHTDSKGSNEINLELSRKRAQNVADFLVEVGNLRKDKIITTGYGEELPIASNETEESRSKNRRIEVLIVNK
ncbi:MAG: OmpA family protein [Desulfobacterales bacterium]|nr:OmpA family protein [Desulfobacterales bacterium]